MDYHCCKMRKTIVIVLVCVISFLLSVNVSADEYSDYLDDFKLALPDTIKEPYNDLELGAALPGFEQIIAYIGECIGNIVRGPIKMGTSICILLILTSVLRLFSDKVGAGGAVCLFDLAVNVSVSLLLISFSSITFDSVFEYVNTLSDFSLSLCPIVVGISIINGNIGESTVIGSGIMLFVSVCEFIVVKFLVPLIKITLALVISSSANNFHFGDPSGFVRFFKSVFTLTLSFCVMCFCSVLSYQTVIASASDSFAQKSVRFTLGAAVPIVGAALGEAVKTVGGALSLLKSTVGAASVSVILLLLLPCIVNLLLSRLTLNFCSAIARMLGCESQAKLLDDIVSICGMCVALVCVVSLMIIFLLSVFAVTSSSIGG